MEIIKNVEKGVSRDEDYWIEFVGTLVVEPHHEYQTMESAEWVIYGDTYYKSEYSVHPSDESKTANTERNTVQPELNTATEALQRLLAQTKKIILPLEWQIHTESIDEALDEATFHHAN
jgi:hypothetical protein